MTSVDVRQGPGPREGARLLAVQLNPATLAWTTQDLGPFSVERPLLWTAADGSGFGWLPPSGAECERLRYRRMTDLTDRATTACLPALSLPPLAGTYGEFAQFSPVVVERDAVFVIDNRDFCASVRGYEAGDGAQRFQLRDCGFSKITGLRLEAGVLLAQTLRPEPGAAWGDRNPNGLLVLKQSGEPALRLLDLPTFLPSPLDGRPGAIGERAARTSNFRADPEGRLFVGAGSTLVRVETAGPDFAPPASRCGELTCEDEVVNVASDADHCGACNIGCADGERCQAGRCTPE